MGAIISWGDNGKHPQISITNPAEILLLSLASWYTFEYITSLYIHTSPFVGLFSAQAFLMQFFVFLILPIPSATFLPLTSGICILSIWSFGNLMYGYVAEFFATILSKMSLFRVRVKSMLISLLREGRTEWSSEFCSRVACFEKQDVSIANLHIRLNESSSSWNNKQSITTQQIYFPMQTMKKKHVQYIFRETYLWYI